MAAATPNELQHLSKDTQYKIRSTQIIVSLPQLVSELVQNGLDADARQVDVGVDCEEWTCWVRDDGKGMSKQDLTALEEAGRYGTSKAYTAESSGEVSTFGFRGEALASIADLSCLEISSRTVRSRECWSLILKGGKSLYNGPAIRWRRESQGTVVCIRDAFYNLPIRRLSHVSSTRTLELTRKELEAFALVFPHVAFSLENTHKASSGRLSAGRIIRIPKTLSTLHAFRHMFGRALVEHVEEIHDTQGDISLDGFISLNGTTSKTYHYLYINRHLLSNCDLHRIIDSAFSASSFGRHAFDEYNQPSQVEAGRRPSDKLERKPVYVLNITVPPRHVDNYVEPAKAAVNLQNNNVVAAFLVSMVQSFLVKHGFKAQGALQHGPAPRKRRKITSDRDAQLSSEHVPVQEKQAELPIAVPELDDDENAGVLWTDPYTGTVYMLDRRSGNSYSVNVTPGGDPLGDPRPRSRRTLQTQPTNSASAEVVEDTPAWIKEALGTNPTYVLQASSIPAVSLSSNFVCEQEHCQHRHGLTTFSSQANALSRTQSQLASFSKVDLSRAVVLGQVDRKFVACVMPSRDPVVLGQGSSPLEGERAGVLVLIDQHAADERIRVERFMRDLCKGFPADSQTNASGPDIRTLEPPAQIVLTRREADLLFSENFQAAFERWGISFRPISEAQPEAESISRFFSTAKVLKSAEHSGYVQVDVLSVPEVVAGKLLVDDRLRDLVKSYLTGLEGSSLAASLLAFRPSSSADDNAVWQRAMQWCPQELHELVNSKACRGAIMFNDPLSLERCVQLVQELCVTALPFQCAHGRPSLVPLTSIQGEVVRGGSSRHVRPVQWATYGKQG